MTTTCFEMESTLWYSLLKQEGYRWWHFFRPKPKIHCDTCGKEICCERSLALVFQKGSKLYAQCTDFYCIDEGYTNHLE